MSNSIPWKKDRSRLGYWMDNHNISQQWLGNKTGLNRSTITELCNNSEYTPHNATRATIIKALRQVDPNVSASDFW
ncbi:XRE family transcriptional regulator [Paenibacillus sp. GYB004]|uniref:XRE family transcriptional regulator n=1 Tax=Paenibacillus sp. GYB004 TaxID=2994393 RepID=UPI002F96AC1A